MVAAAAVAFATRWSLSVRAVPTLLLGASDPTNDVSTCAGAPTTSTSTYPATTSILLYSLPTSFYQYLSPANVLTLTKSIFSSVIASLTNVGIRIYLKITVSLYRCREFSIHYVLNSLQSTPSCESNIFRCIVFTSSSYSLNGFFVRNNAIYAQIENIPTFHIG